MAVFLAGSALGVLQHLETDGLAEIVRSDGKGCLEKSQQLLIWTIQHGVALASWQRFAAQSFDSKILVVDHGTLHHL